MRFNILLLFLTYRFYKFCEKQNLESVTVQKLIIVLRQECYIILITNYKYLNHEVSYIGKLITKPTCNHWLFNALGRSEVQYFLMLALQSKISREYRGEIGMSFEIPMFNYAIDMRETIRECQNWVSLGRSKVLSPNTEMTFCGN